MLRVRPRSVMLVAMGSQTSVRQRRWPHSLIDTSPDIERDKPTLRLGASPFRSSESQNPAGVKWDMKDVRQDLYNARTLLPRSSFGALNRQVICGATDPAVPPVDP